jgi:hypothetical protein
VELPKVLLAAAFAVSGLAVYGFGQDAMPPAQRPSALEKRLSVVASTVAGRPVGVRCEDLSDLRDAVEPGGVVEFTGERPADHARIRLDICAQLGQLRRDHGAGGGAEARAVEVLAHESFHLRGIKNEAVTECYALQFVPLVARSLGATSANADRLELRALHAYPYHPPAYLSAECRPGGALDLGVPQSGDHPSNGRVNSAEG